MDFKVNGKDYELKYTFNSFNYMRELNFDKLNNIEKTPFEMIPMLEMMIMGGLNHNPKKKFDVASVQDAIEEYADENSIAELFPELFALLEESRFFKALQKNQ